jgi:hypothetical protein
VGFGCRALEHSPEPGRPTCLDTLAAALAEDGDFTKAVDRQRETISLTEDIGRRVNYEERLLLYENRELYREEPAD